VESLHTLDPVHGAWPSPRLDRAFVLGQAHLIARKVRACRREPSDSATCALLGPVYSIVFMIARANFRHVPFPLQAS